MRLRGPGSTLGVLRTLLNFADIMDRQGVPTILPSNLYLLNLSTTPPLSPRFFYIMKCLQPSPTSLNTIAACICTAPDAGSGRRPASLLLHSAVLPQNPWISCPFRGASEIAAKVPASPSASLVVEALAIVRQIRWFENLGP